MFKTLEFFGSLLAKNVFCMANGQDQIPKCNTNIVTLVPIKRQVITASSWKRKERFSLNRGCLVLFFSGANFGCFWPNLASFGNQEFLIPNSSNWFLSRGVGNTEWCYSEVDDDEKLVHVEYKLRQFEYFLLQWLEDVIEQCCTMMVLTFG